jgi:hypothetical protein
VGYDDGFKGWGVYSFLKNYGGYNAMNTLQVTRKRTVAGIGGVFALFFIAPTYAQDATAVVQNAILEGIQFSSEDGKEPGEKVVTCYFIFKDKPSSYFYEVKKKQKKLMFEFNDTQKGDSPVPSLKEVPIEGFQIEQKKIDVNKEVKGLNQEWHDLIAVTFDLRKIPQIDVKDEYTVISFTYKWTTDPLKEKNYEIKDESKNNLVVWGSIGGLGLVGGGVAAYYILHKAPPAQPDGPVPLDGLPIHPN